MIWTCLKNQYLPYYQKDRIYVRRTFNIYIIFLWPGDYALFQISGTFFINMKTPELPLGRLIDQTECEATGTCKMQENVCWPLGLYLQYLVCLLSTIIIWKLYCKNQHLLYYSNRYL